MRLAGERADLIMAAVEGFFASGGVGDDERRVERSAGYHNYKGKGASLGNGYQGEARFGPNRPAAQGRG